MVMAADLFRHQVRGKVPEQTQELTELVLLGAKRIQSEVEEVLSYLNLPAMAKTGSHFCISSLDGLVIQTCKDLGLEKYSYNMADGTRGDLTLRLSNRAVEVVVWEIIENARKFHPRGCPALDVSVSAEGQDAVKVTFRDNGINLPPEQIRQAWMPYYQGEKEFTGEVEGMGLGLATVSKLVWEVGGSCRLSNRSDGPGVIVEVTIPTA
jgi:signal transduction histidine kinase